LLKTKKVTLRKSNEKDLNYIINEEAGAADLAYVNAWSLDAHKKAQENPLTDHMIIESGEGETVGYLIGNQNPDDNYELMRIVVSKKGFAYGRAAIEALIDYAFTMSTHRFWLDVRMHNVKAIALYENMGFQTEGILREAVKLKDRYVSVKVMSILRAEYEL
jgi:RimJ/RimL family protein N-acetyltransferase